MYQQFNDPIVVQKYGGTSVGTVERIHAVAARVAQQHQNGYRRLAIVVSAMAGETNRLVDLVRQVSAQANPRISDLAVSAGEQVSVALTAAAIEAHGIKTVPLLGFQLGVITDNLFSRARVQEIDTTKITAAWEQGAIPIIAGFQGITRDMNITTLGRGGSDTSAVAVAAALKADFCEINTDVDGFYSADPRYVKEAQLIEVMDYNVALEMAALGSKVLHSRCVELGAKFGIPLVVRNSFKPDDSRRTIVMNFNAKQMIEAPVVSGVSVERNVGRVAIETKGMYAQSLTKIFSAIAEAQINVDIIVHNHALDSEELKVAFTVTEADLQRAAQVIDSLRTTQNLNHLKVATEGSLAKVSIVGLGMQSHHGVAAQAFSILSTNNIDIRMISTSEIKISCVVPQDSVDNAASLLHNQFILN